MRYAHLFVLVLVSTLTPAAFADTCTVTTAAELNQALLDSCENIIIPAYDDQNPPQPVIIEVPFQFNGSTVNWFTIQHWPEHDPPIDNDNLHLTIDGTIKWTGPIAGNLDTYKIFRLANVTSVTIDGSGRITSDYEHGDLSVNEHIATAFLINGAIDLKINGTIDQASNGLHFDNVDHMVLMEGASCSNVELKNLFGTELVYYGVFAAGFDGLLVENCHVGEENGANGTYERHAFRFYGDNLRVQDCSAFNILGSYGIWPVEGNNIVIDNFSTNKYCAIGPNTCDSNCSSANGVTDDDRLFNVQVSNLHIADTQTLTNWLRIEQGTWHVSLDNCSASQLTIGEDSNSCALACFEEPRPIDRIHWNGCTFGTIGFADNSDIGDDIGAVCFGDIDSSGQVDVSDLLAVISQ